MAVHPPLKLVRPRASPPKAPFAGDDVALVAAFRYGDPEARTALYGRYADHVHRVLYRLLGFDQDLSDLHHDVFVRALVSLPTLEDAAALKGWLTIIAVHVACTALARRKRRRWLLFLPSDELPERAAEAPTTDVVDALRATYAVLDALPSEERIVFALRFIDGMELTEVAAACEISLATTKRRLARASTRFAVAVRKHPALECWAKGGSRWSLPSKT